MSDFTSRWPNSFDGRHAKSELVELERVLLQLASDTGIYATAN